MARISLRVDHPRTRMISISTEPSSKIRNEAFEHPQLVVTAVSITRALEFSFCACALPRHSFTAGLVRRIDVSQCRSYFKEQNMEGNLIEG